MPEDATERAVTLLIPFADTTITGAIEQLDFRPEVIFAEERAYINTFQHPFRELIERSSGILENFVDSEAAEAYERGVYIMHDLFRRQGGWKHGVLPPVTEELCKSYLQDNFERGQNEDSFLETHFHKEGDRLEEQESKITRLFNILRKREGDNFVYVIGGLADAYFLYRKALKTRELESKFRVSANP